VRFWFHWFSFFATLLGCFPASAAEIGAGVQLKILIPNNLPDFRTSVPVYGPEISLTWKPHGVQVQAAYGSSDGVTAYLGEMSYRYQIETPFFNFFLSSGLHFLYYAPVGAPDQRMLGAHFGPGLVLRFGDSLIVPLQARLMFQKQSIISVGGGLVFIL